MDRDALPTMEDFDGRRAAAQIDGLAGETVWSAVVVPLEGNVIVDAVDPRLLPLRVLVGVFGERLHRRPVQFLEAGAATAAEILEGGSLSSSKSLVISRFSSLRLKNMWFLSRARIQRSTSRTPASALALSRDFRTRAGMTVVP